MTRENLREYIKTILSELLTPEDVNVLISSTDQPIDVYLDSLSDLALDEFYRAIPPRVILPRKAEWYVIPANCAMLIPFSEMKCSGTADMVNLTSTEFIPLDAVTFALAIESGFDDGMIIKLTESFDSWSLPLVANDTLVCYNGKAYILGNDITVDVGDKLMFIGDDVCVGEFVKDDAWYSPTIIGDFTKSYCSSVTKNITEVLLPFSYLELTEMSYPSWINRPVVISVDDKAYALQCSLYTRSGYVKPVVALSRNEYSLTSCVKEEVTAIITSEMYIAKVFSPDGDEELETCLVVTSTPLLNIPTHLIEVFCYLVAGNYLLAIGNNKAESCLGKYKSLIEQL